MKNILGILAALTVSTRFYNLSVPSYVCWDETHFGKMAGLYLNRTYFVDVHPPLGKMLIALAGLLTGYDGQFSFTEPGNEYITEAQKVRYYGMRGFSALLGSMVIPLMYCTVKILTGREEPALFTSVLLMFDCGLITISQYILLDPTLLFFASASIFCTMKYSTCTITYNDEIDSFSTQWWLYLTLSGICLGCTVAIKWTGLFTVIFIGCWTIKDLWNMLGNVQTVTMNDFIKHFLSRVIGLIFVPCFVYIFIFALHYQVLTKSGQADGFHTSLFQTCLKGNPLYNTSMPLNVAYGSIITLKHYRTSSSGLLHSHDKPYPLEVMPFPHQQITLYFHKDPNNLWEVLKPSQHEYNLISKKSSIRNTVNSSFLEDGSIVRLKHLLTGHHLHSHPRPAPMTPRQQIVSGHKYSTGGGKLNELWRLEIINPHGNGSRLEVLTTHFRIIHINTGCMLQSSLKILPDWGEKQYEVTCSHHRRDRRIATWNVEQHSNRRLGSSTFPPCQMTFWGRFLESHMSMASFNSEMKISEGEKPSRPWHWPINYKGQAFTRMGENDLRVYLLGNPLIFWLNFIIILLSSAFAIFLNAAEQRGRGRSRRGINRSADDNIYSLGGDNAKHPGMKERWVVVGSIDFARQVTAVKWFLLAWALHYLPFLLMSRVLYFHHYYPAFLFSCCLSGCFLDLLFKGCSIYLSRLLRHTMTSSTIYYAIICLFVSFVLESFYLYSPLCYGMIGPPSHKKEGVMYGLKFFQHWEI